MCVQPRNVVGGHIISAVIALVLDSNKELFGMNQVVRYVCGVLCGCVVK